MWLLLVLEIYLHQIMYLNTKVLKVLQVSLELFIGWGYYVCKKSKFLTSFPLHVCIRKMIHFEKREIKYTTD